MRRLAIAMILAGSIVLGGQAPSQAAVTASHEGHFHPLYYVTHQHHRKVFVDISGNGWESKQDAKRESRRLLRWLQSIGY